MAFGAIVVANAHPGLPDYPYIREIMAFLAFAASVTLLVLFIFLGRRNRLAYVITLGFFNAVSLLTIFDDFGWTDLAVLTMNIVPVVLLIKSRTWYFKQQPGTADGQKTAP